MKTCPYCAEEIQHAAIKCKHCGEFLDGTVRPRGNSNEVVPWYYRGGFLALAALTVGPLMLPLIWLHPKMAMGWKIALSAIILAVTFAIIWSFYLVTQELRELLPEMNSMFKEFGVM